MRNLFGVLAILFAVIALGVFRVPDENALVAAGIRAEARSALYDQRHPLTADVTGRVVTVEGRVESEAGRLEVLGRLAALDGVEQVVDRLSVLPSVTPFVLEAVKTAEGVTVAGHVPRAALAEEIAAALGVAVAAPVATGAPDGWGDVALQAVRALAALRDGRMILTDRVLVLEGRTLLPHEADALRAGLATLPEGFEADLRIEAIDDGLPYSLLIARDPLMGLRVSGKLPPDFDPARLGVLGPAQVVAVAIAPLPLDHPGFPEALEAVLPLAAELPAGVVHVAPGVVALSGGPVPAGLMAAATALDLPHGWALQSALVPQDAGGPLALTAGWDGARLSLEGRVPADFDGAAVPAALGVAPGFSALEQGPYPDLAGWDAALLPALRGLVLLQAGVLTYAAGEARIEGIAADPAVRRAAAAVSGLSMAAVQLADDGSPTVFTLTYDATSGGRVSGKLPAGLSPAVLAGALGLSGLRGAPVVAPDGDGAAALSALRSVAPLIAEVETLTLSFDRGAVALEIGTVRGADPEALRAAIAVPEARVAQAPDAPGGTRRVHAALGIPQVFADGWWFPALDIDASPEGCAQAAAAAPEMEFAPGRFLPGPGAGLALAHLAAVARPCTRLAGLTLVIEADAASAPVEILNRQLSRRRAETLRDALVQRGVDPARVEATGVGQGAADRITYRWQ